MNPTDPTTQTFGESAESKEETLQALSMLSGSRPGGLPEGDEFSDVDGHSRALSQNTILLLAVVVVAAGVLYGMRLMQGEVKEDQDSVQAAARIEEALAKLTQPGAISANDPLRQENLSALMQDTDQIIAMFAGDASDQYVPVQYIKKNPFRLTQPQAAPQAPTGAAADKARERLLQQLRSEADRLELQTVMGGQTPIAVINGEFYRKGQTVGSFTIESITADTLMVVLVSEGQRFTLSMQDSKETNRRR